MLCIHLAPLGLYIVTKLTLYAENTKKFVNFELGKLYPYE